jgi:leucyl-tRNA synthetase
MAYDHLEIEARWQRYWDEHGTFRATRDATVCAAFPPRICGG